MFLQCQRAFHHSILAFQPFRFLCYPLYLLSTMLLVSIRVCKSFGSLGHFLCFKAIVLHALNYAWVIAWGLHLQANLSNCQVVATKWIVIGRYAQGNRIPDSKTAILPLPKRLVLYWLLGILALVASGHILSVSSPLLKGCFQKMLKELFQVRVFEKS